MVRVRNGDIAKFGSHIERQTSLKMYVDRRGPRSREKLVEEQVQSHVKKFTRKIKGDKKVKHKNANRVAKFCFRNPTQPRDAESHP